jgi:hypothetical protein
MCYLRKNSSAITNIQRSAGRYVGRQEHTGVLEASAKVMADEEK